jgi:hypothetical protein
MAARKLVIKTRQNAASVPQFIGSVKDAERRADCRTLLKLMEAATGLKPKMWGTSIVGFGTQTYRVSSGKEGEWFLIGFSPRKQDLTLYITTGVKRYPTLLHKLGKHKTGVSCLYLKRLADVDLTVLEELIAVSLPAGDRASAHPVLPD